MIVPAACIEVAAEEVVKEIAGEFTGRPLTVRISLALHKHASAKDACGASRRDVCDAPAGVDRNAAKAIAGVL